MDCFVSYGSNSDVHATRQSHGPKFVWDYHSFRKVVAFLATITSNVKDSAFAAVWPITQRDLPDILTELDQYVQCLRFYGSSASNHCAPLPRSYSPPSPGWMHGHNPWMQEDNGLIHPHLHQPLPAANMSGQIKSHLMPDCSRNETYGFDPESMTEISLPRPYPMHQRKNNKRFRYNKASNCCVYYGTDSLCSKRGASSSNISSLLQASSPNKFSSSRKVQRHNLHPSRGSTVDARSHGSIGTPVPESWKPTFEQNQAICPNKSISPEAAQSTSPIVREQASYRKCAPRQLWGGEKAKHTLALGTHPRLIRQYLRHCDGAPKRELERRSRGWSVRTAAAVGHCRLLQQRVLARPAPRPRGAVDLAAQHGHLRCVEWLHRSRTEPATLRAVRAAAGGGHLPVVEWLLTHTVQNGTARASDWAARGGHLRVLEWLARRGDRGCSRAAMDWAAAAGRLRVVEWLHARRGEGCSRAALDGAATNGHLSTVEWLLAHRSEVRRPSYCGAIEKAAANGHASVARFLQEQQPPLRT